jgi:AcrR family transcriptional regulator
LLLKLASLFYTEGIRAVGIDRIIAEAGVAKATFYNYFPSKDDLVLAYIEEQDRLGRAAVAALPKQPPRDRIAAGASARPWSREVGVDARFSTPRPNIQPLKVPCGKPLKRGAPGITVSYGTSFRRTAIRPLPLLPRCLSPYQTACSKPHTLTIRRPFPPL